MEFAVAIRRLIEVYEGASTVKSGARYTTVNELADQLPATRPDTLEAAVEGLLHIGPITGNKILSEEDKGALLVGLIAVATKTPIAMARWYSYPIPAEESIVVPIDMEYAKGQLLVNGINKGDKISIIDDTLSTGGTALSLIQATRGRGAEVVEMRVVVEKLGFGGREKMEAEGVKVKSVIGITVIDGKIRVAEVMGRPINREAYRCQRLL